jgi:hypothetical protein
VVNQWEIENEIRRMRTERGGRYTSKWAFRIYIWKASCWELDLFNRRIFWFSLETLVMVLEPFLITVQCISEKSRDAFAIQRDVVLCKVAMRSSS